MVSTLDEKAELWEVLNSHPHLFMSREQAGDWLGAGTTGLLRRGQSCNLCHCGRRKVHGCLQILMGFLLETRHRERGPIRASSCVHGVTSSTKGKHIDTNKRREEDTS